ncbi:MAG: TonB-dependent receptor, partial [Psychrosphaera sp.]|nr:TonB-dependent receptor [Psychrosphaera sp.]
DAISAEDIGKFPDTNLAESLQRITGVSIDRANGEGSKVTVRGFGPDFNMVTLNGRTMPGSSLPSGGGVANSRAYDFANLSSDAVKSVSVYKTGRADIATGGIGASINIVTAKPLDNPGLHINFGGKALFDTTNRVGDDATPEFSGLLSWTDEDERFGASITANLQERHSSATGAFVNQWRTGVYDGTIPQAADDIVITNEPAIGQLYSMPSDLRYSVADRERTRTNAQINLQFRPSDKLTATLDYTYSQQDLHESRAEQSVWMDTYKTALTFDNETVATPVQYSEERRDLSPRDLGLALQELNQVNTNKSIGLNLNYDVNDYFNVTFDMHDSSAKSSPDAAYGSWMNVGLGANIAAAQSVDFSQPMPTMTIVFDDCDPSRGLNCNGVLDQNDVGTSILDMNYASQTTDISQYRLMGSLEFDESGIEGGIDFGIESRSMESHSVQSLTRHTMGNWGVENPGELPDNFLSPTDFTAEFDDYETNGAFNQGMTGNAAQVGAWAAGNYGFVLEADGAYATNRTIKEDVTAAYFQVNVSDEFNGKPYNVLAGVRYEKTDVTSIANVTLPNAVAWEGNQDFNVRFGSGTEDFATDANYDHILPSLDFDIEVVENVKVRFSYSTTIARATYDQLSSAAANVSGPSGPTNFSGVQMATASNGNPALAPLESDNIDVSLEWY